MRDLRAGREFNDGFSEGEGGDGSGDGAVGYFSGARVEVGAGWFGVDLKGKVAVGPVREGGVTPVGVFEGGAVA